MPPSSVGRASTTSPAVDAMRRIVGDVDERTAVVKIFSHLGLPADPPPIARARDPAELGFA